jgi:hypothetical protein
MATTIRRVRAVEKPGPGDWQLPAGQLPATLAESELFANSDDFEQTDTDRVAEMLQASASVGRASIKVYKIENGQSAYCASYAPSVFEEGDYDMVRQSFGAGKYKFMLYGAKPDTGKFCLLSRVEVTIAEDQKPVSNYQQNPSPASDPAMAQILASLAQGQQQIVQALANMGQQPQRDPMVEMQQMLTMAGAMKAAFATDQPKTSPISEIVAAMRELRSASEELIPGGESEKDPLLSMLPQVLDVIKSGVQQQQQVQSLPQIALPQSLQNVPTPTPQGDDMKFTEMLRLRGYLQNLISMATAGKPSSEGAKYVYDVIPDELVDLMGEANWLDLLALVSPGISAHAGWLTLVRDEALKMFDEPDPVATPASA